MADKDFVVKNGLVVNSNTTVNGFIANSTQFTFSTINATSNGILANTTAINFGNSSVYLSMNTTGVSNAFRLGGSLASDYALKTEVGGLVGVPATYVQNSDSRVLSGNLNFTGTNNYFSSPFFVGDNVSLTTTSLTVGNSVSNSTLTARYLQLSSSSASPIANLVNLSYAVGSRPLINFYSSNTTDTTLFFGGLQWFASNAAGNFATTASLYSTGDSFSYYRADIIAAVNANSNIVLQAGGSASNTLVANTTGVYLLPNTFTIGTGSYFVSNGNFGISNAVPTDKLSVNGKAFFQGNVTFKQGIVDSTGTQGTSGQVLTSNGSGNVYWSTVTSGVPATYVQNSDSRVLSGNLNFTGTNVYFTAATFSPAGIYFGIDSTANLVVNSSTFFVGNATVNSITNSTIMQLSNSTTTANLTSGSLTIGTSVVNTTSLAAGANVIANTTAILVGNSTVRIVSNSTLLQISNTLSVANLTPASLVIGNTSTTTSLNGVSSYSKIGDGVYGFSNNGTGVHGYSPYAGYGVFGESNSSVGVGGNSLTNYGVLGLSNSSYGVYAVSNTGIGLYAQSNTGIVANFANATDNFARIVANGNIGIGTITPDYKLTVNGSVRSIGLKTYELSTPTNLSLSAVSGGSLASSIYYVRVAAVDSVGGMTETSSEVSRTVTIGSLRVQFDAVPGAVKYRIYFNAGSSMSDIYASYSYFESSTNDYTITTTTGAGSWPIRTYNSTGSIKIGEYANTDYKLVIQNNSNGAGQFLIYNSNTGASAMAGFDMYHGASLSTSYFYHGNDGKLYIKGGAGISFATGSYSGTERMILTNGNLAVTYSVTAGTLGVNQVGPAIIGYCQTQNSIFGQSYGGIGVVGQSNTGSGIFGVSNTYTGVYGQSNTNYGVYGYSNSSVGVYGVSATTVGTAGYSENWAGVWGKSNNSWGVYCESISGNPLFVGNTGGTEFMRVSSNGNVGIANPTPAYKLSIVSPVLSSTIYDDSKALEIKTNNGNWNYFRIHTFRNAAGSDWTTSTTRLEQVTDSTLQGWIDYNSPGNLSGISLGSGYTTIAKFDSNGLVGIGNTSPSNRLVVETSSTLASGTLSVAEFRGGGSSENGGQIKLYNSYSGATNPAKYFRVTNSGTFQILNNAYDSALIAVNESGDFTAAGNVTAYSDLKLKTDICTINNALDKVSKMRGVMFTRKDTGGRGTGVIAQEIKEVLPEVVIGDETLSVAYGNIVGVLIEAIKELKAEIAELKGGK